MGKSIPFRRKEYIKSASLGSLLKNDFLKNWQLYLIFLPVLIYYLVFSYGPMYGILVAFQRFNIRKGIWGSEWIGFENFVTFFNSYYFVRILGNTFKLSIADLVLAWPSSIIFALLLNEVSKSGFKRWVQTFSYLPHFVSMVVICGIIKDFTNTNGTINDIISFFGFERQSLLINSKLFIPIYVVSNIWQGMGYGSIIYIAAISSINPELYESAIIDGAGRLRQTIHITLPGITPTIITLLILRIGNILHVGFEKILLLQNNSNIETSEVISTFVYKKGLVEAVYGYSTAVNLFNSIVCLVFLFGANMLSRKFSETSLW